MKKASAFSVFKTKKEKSEPNDGNENFGTLRKAASHPVMTDVGAEKALSKKLLRALKSGSVRATFRERKKAQPVVLPSPSLSQIADDNIKLTGLRSKDSPKKAGKSNSSTTVNQNGTVKQIPKAQVPPMNILEKVKTKPPVPNAPAKKTRKRSSEDADIKSSKRLRNDVLSGFNDQSTEEVEKGMTFEDSTTQLPFMYDSTVEGKKLFEFLIHPVLTDKFFRELWEKKPLLVKRHMPEYNDGWFSTAELDNILRKENIQYSVNLDITTYENGKRETHNPVGRAYAPVVWDYYQNGCSIRMLNPQTYSKHVWKLLSTLQEYFGSFVGANVYLTPPGTQGFAPHFDDIEAFILQLEGKKYWRLYSPRSENETLPRYSSDNLSEDDIGEPILDVVLEAGDLLYFPRGTIHQGKCLEDAHSMHITFSCFQKNSWGDFLEKLLPQALQVAIDEDVEFREGLPREYLGYMGIANCDRSHPDRKGFMKKIEQLVSRMMNYAPVDAACDQMGKKYIHDSLPPVLTEEEKSCSIHGCGEKWNKRKMQVEGAVEMEPDTNVKLIRKGIIRLVSEEDEVRVYHCLENSKVFHGNDIQFIEIPAESAPAVEFLLESYPEYVKVDSLPLGAVQDKVDIAVVLYEKGLLMTSEPLEDMDDVSSDGEG